MARPLRVTIEVAPSRVLRVENIDGSEATHYPGSVLTMPWREGRKLIRAGHAVRVSARG